jgi:hypothetical protein
MRSWPPAPLDPMKFPLTLAGQLRRAFNHVGLSPLPQKLAELVRRVKSDKTNDGEGSKPSSVLTGGYDADSPASRRRAKETPPRSPT